jgi:hypothetical protein
MSDTEQLECCECGNEINGELFSCECEPEKFYCDRHKSILDCYYNHMCKKKIELEVILEIDEDDDYKKSFVKILEDVCECGQFVDYEMDYSSLRGCFDKTDVFTIVTFICQKFLKNKNGFDEWVLLDVKKTETKVQVFFGVNPVA